MGSLEAELWLDNNSFHFDSVEDCFPVGCHRSDDTLILLCQSVIVSPVKEKS